MSPLRYRYQTIELTDFDIHIRTLRDKQQFCDDEGKAAELGISSALWPLFGVLWPSGEVLARLMADYDIEGKRILEVGCGIGLASIVLNHRDADITATDYHPEVEGFLDENTRINNDDSIPFVRTAWENDSCELGEFDLVIGSDLLYEQEHAELLSDFIDQHTSPDGEVIIIDPGRGNHARFSKFMIERGYTHRQHAPESTDYLEKPFNGQILRYT